MNRRLVLALSLLAVFTVRAATAETVFVDDAGRSVPIARPIARVIPAGPPADALLVALAPDLLVGLVHPFTEEQKRVLPAGWRDLAIVPRLTAEPSKGDLAAIAALKPDLVVDYGDVTAKYAALADRVTADTGIPAVLLDGRLNAVPGTLRRLAALLGRAADGERLAGLADMALVGLTPTRDLADGDRVPVYLARGYDGLDAVAAGSQLDEALLFAGGRNVVARERGVFRAMTPDAVAAARPKVVVVEQAEAMAADAPLRKALPAETVFLLDDYHGFHRVENPPSVNRLIGAVWLALRLHPDRVRFDDATLAELTRAFLHTSE